jgi:predicted ATP-grasp superfamily ATP-dependent carboligase
MTKSDNNQKLSRVLVLDGNQFSTLAIVRSLGRKNILITVAGVEGKPPGIASYSKYVSQVVTYADPLSAEDRFVDSIKNLISQQNFDLLIPVTENTVIPLAKRRSELEKFCRLAIPDNSSLQAVLDKNQTFQLAQEENVPVPVGILIKDIASLSARLAALQYPIVIKPSHSVAETGTAARTKLNVQYAFDEQELLEKCKAILRYTPAILQEYFRGDGVGIEVLADQGELVLVFQHKRLHEFPLTGGGSTLRTSEAVNPQLLEHSRRLIKRLNWHGVAMLEYKYNAASGQCRLMEINGRFWGSLPLAVAAGADFPYALYSLLVSNTVLPTTPYQIGWLNRKLTEDLYWLLVVLFRRDNNPLIIWPSFKQILADCLSMFSLKHRFDSFAYDDPKPFLIDCCHTSAWGFDLLKNFITDRYLTQKFLQIKQSGSLNPRLQSAKNILFLCYGNINRSVLAEQCFRFQNQHFPELQIDSAGFHPIAGRAADPTMVEVSARNGINLQNWSSKTVSAETINNADLILVMEIAHYRKLVASYPNCKHKVYLLGCTTPDGQLCPLEIEDPYEREVEIYAQCFNSIQNAIKAMIDIKSTPA